MENSQNIYWLLLMFDIIWALSCLGHIQFETLLLINGLLKRKYIWVYAETRKKKLNQMTHETTKSHLEEINVICTLAAILDPVAILNSDTCKLIISFHKALCMNCYDQIDYRWGMYSLSIWDTLAVTYIY